MKTLTIKSPVATREQLLGLANEVPGAWVGLKIAALLLVVEGQRPGWITRVLGLTRMSVSRWIHGVNGHGVGTLKERPRPGRPGQLDKKLQKILEDHLEKAPSDFGLHRSRWDGPTVTMHLKRQFGIKLKVRQAQYWMHQLGYRMKRASHVYVQARAQDARRFQRHIKKAPNTSTS